MPSTRSKNKAEIGGYFDIKLVARVTQAARSLGITVTDFAAAAYRTGLESDRHKPSQARRRRLSA
ncbi:MAG: hypothetical protein BWX48_01991 [Verrucomicrobia bacterium ADurb.Bin006]|jgi:hypothetical protein|nr:MAG: hypothetical protein BWX48_01991 [Verrucomicrobia bacterium ADurb.Bin006]